MIVEIESSRPSCRASLDYNEGKVLRGVAELAAYANMDSIAHEDILRLFSRYENHVRQYVHQRSFHASVNPSADDTCTEAQVLEFISGMMDHIGLGNQPFLVYRHFDIEREHYHIVSVRIDADGHKISNWYEWRRVKEYMRENARRFSFSVAEKGFRVSADITSGDTGSFLRFNPRKGVVPQMREIVSRALGYDFDSFAQFSCILEDMGLAAAVENRRGVPVLSLRGLDRDGMPATGSFTEGDLGEPVLERMEAALSRNATGHSRRIREKGRVRSLAVFAFDISRSEGHFVNILRHKGIGVHFSRTKASGDIFGITFVDHTARTVFKASEIRNVISVQAMREAVSSGRWRVEDRGSGKSSYVCRSRAEAKEDAVRLRDLHAGAVARALEPVGQPVGASWSGRVKPDKEQRRARWDEERAGAMDVDFEDRRFEEKLS